VNRLARQSLLGSATVITFKALNHNINSINLFIDHPFLSSICKHLPINIMKLAITSLLVVAFMSAAVHAGFHLRAAGEPSEAMITTPSDQSIDNNNERELLSPWCDPATPVEWHP